MKLKEKSEYVEKIMKENNTFVVKKLPKFSEEEFFNVKIDSNNFIIDKNNLIKFKAAIDKSLT